MSLPERPGHAELPRNPARRRAFFAAGELALVAASAPSALAQAPVSAPLRVMHGFADHQGMDLWVQGSGNRGQETGQQGLEIEVRQGDERGAVVQALPLTLDLRSDYTETVHFAGLDPGERYSYVIRSPKDGAVLARGAFRTQVLWQWRTDPPTVRIATGSCAYLNDNRFDRPGRPYGAGEEIFDTIAGLSPDLMLWLGDNIYLREAEYTSREGINRRYRFYRSHPSLAKLWTATPNVAIWDDHDFGPDNSDFSYAGAGWTREMFHRYWPLPYAAPADGLYGKVLQGDVDIFMLDDRSYRYPQAWPEGPDKAMYGAKQMLWLKAALTSSRAPFKLIAGGSQFFNRVSHAESWMRYPAEAADFLAFLEQRRIPGVIFLSGDRHFAQHLRAKRGGLYALNEITTSALTSSAPSRLDEAETTNPDMVPGTMLMERNFALITVTGPRTQRALTIEIRDTKGNKRWEWATTAADLAQGTRA